MLTKNVERDADSSRVRAAPSRIAACILLGLTIATLATDMACGQQAPARTRHDNPPPIESLTGSPPPGPTEPVWPRLLRDKEHIEDHATITCQSGDTSCHDLMGYGAAARLYYRIRRCWQPPEETVVTAEFDFGENAKSAKPPNPAGTVVSLAFGLNPNGMLGTRPHPNVPNSADAVAGDVIRAIERCQPYDMLPATKYAEWKDVLVHIRIDARPHQQQIPPPKIRLLPVPPDAYRA